LNHCQKISKLIRNKQFYYLGFAVIFGLLVSGYYEQGNVDLEAKVKAAYIYNFTKFFDWGTYNSENFVIDILGSSGVLDQLNKIAGKEKVNGKTIIVNKINDLSDLEFCNILFLPNANGDIFNNVLKKTRNKKILIIANSNGFAEKGAGINFIQVGDKIKFEINKSAIEEAGIIPNSNIFSIAYKMYE